MFTDSDLEALEALQSFIGEPPPEYAPKQTDPAGWRPDLNPTQQLIFDDAHPNCFADGEKASAKSVGFLFKLVRHCYEAGDPKNPQRIAGLAFIIVKGYSTGDIGIWYDLEHLVLPTWREGNRYPERLRLPDGSLIPHPRAGEQADHGIGLEYTPTKLDPKSKACKIFIGNRHGTWSLVILISVPHAVMIKDRMKGPAPSFIFVDELTDCETRDYYSYPSAQLGRRRGVGDTPQQYCAAMNPAGPSHWAYKLIFEECAVEKDQPGYDWPDGIRRNHRFSRYHVPLEENLHRLPDGYAERLHDSFKDPIDIQRFKDGIWVDRPTGTAIFRDCWAPAVHIRGDLRRGTGLIPDNRFSILVGHDPGPVNYCLSFEQLIPAQAKLALMIFDELNFVGKRLPYFRVVPAIMRRMAYWQQMMGARLGNPGFRFHFEHIADEAAFNQLDKHGQFDYQTIEAESRKWVATHPEANLQPIKLKPCPKGADSVPARVQMTQAFMQMEALLVSAMCIKTCEMFAMLESQDEKEGKYDPLTAFTPKRSIYVHPFDSVSYPAFYYAARGKAGPRTAKVETRVYECGTR